MIEVRANWLGRIPYKECWDSQLALHAEIVRGNSPSTILLLEHEPVVTVGRHGESTNIYFTAEQLADKGVDLHYVERGGDVTYHGPGQLVGYPLLNLKELDISVAGYLRTLEESLILLLAGYGLETSREAGFTGVWHKHAKVAAIGIAVKRWVSFHGFALNVSTDLDYFKLINPCGLSRPVTSIKELTGKDMNCRAVAETYLECFARAYGVTSTNLVDDASAGQRKACG